MKKVLEYTKTSFMKGVAFAVGIATTGLLAATLSSSITTFNGGDPLTASTMNANFGAIKSRLGTYCGQTAATTGNIGGYAAAKSLCETACGVSTAHMCTSHEISISLQLGESLPSAVWYSDLAYKVNSGGAPITDCRSWTSASGSYGGNVFQGAEPSYDLCNSSRPVACCS